MSVDVEALFTKALGLVAPWQVEQVELDTAKRRIDFHLVCNEKRLDCPACHAIEQGIHDRLEREWRHLDFFQFEAYLHAKVPRVHCLECGKTLQAEVPWARPGSNFTLLFEALALSLCKDLPVLQAANLLRCVDKKIWRFINHYVPQARKLDDMSEVKNIGIDETSLHKGHSYITVVHDLQEKRLLFATEGKDHETVVRFAKDLKEHGGNPEQIEHVCQDMSAAFAKGVAEALPKAEICYDRFHIAAMAGEAMQEVHRSEIKTNVESIEEALGEDPKVLKNLRWGMLKDPSEWNQKQTAAMHKLQRTTLKSARAWRLKMDLRRVYNNALVSNDKQQAQAELKGWLSWAKRSRLEPFKKLAVTLQGKFDAVVRGMLDHRNNAYVEAMNGLLQQAKRAARGYRDAGNFISIAYLRMSKLKHIPNNPLELAAPLTIPNGSTGVLIHRCL